MKKLLPVLFLASLPTAAVDKISESGQDIDVRFVKSKNMAKSKCLFSNFEGRVSAIEERACDNAEKAAMRKCRKKGHLILGEVKRSKTKSACKVTVRCTKFKVGGGMPKTKKKHSARPPVRRNRSRSFTSRDDISSRYTEQSQVLHSEGFGRRFSRDELIAFDYLF